MLPAQNELDQGSEGSSGDAVEERAPVFKLEESGCVENKNNFCREDRARGKEKQLGTLGKAATQEVKCPHSILPSSSLNINTLLLKQMPLVDLIHSSDQLNGLELEQTPGDSEGQRSLACCSPWGHKESDTTQQLNK